MAPPLLEGAAGGKPMRTILWSTALSLSLVAAVGCQRDEAAKVRAAEKNVQEQREDIRDEQKDVAKQQRELAEAKAKLETARAEYVQATRERLAKIDGRIAELEAKADAKSKQAAADLR